MIVQQINLYQDRFREKRVWVSATQVAAALLLLLVVGAAWSYLLQDRLDRGLQRGLALDAERERVAGELAASNAELAALLEDNQLDRDIEQVARQISARKKVLQFVNDNRFGSGEGFSGYLVALSRLRVENVWLSRIHLAQNFIRIKGSSLNAEQVPAYFERFGSEPVFVGNRFDLFELSRGKETQWKVDFEIATRSVINE